MAEMILRLTAKDRNALCWLAGNDHAAPPHVGTFIDLHLVELVNILDPDNGSATFSLTERGKAEAAKGLPAKRAPRKPKAAAGGKGGGK